MQPIEKTRLLRARAPEKLPRLAFIPTRGGEEKSASAKSAIKLRNNSSRETTKKIKITRKRERKIQLKGDRAMVRARLHRSLSSNFIDINFHSFCVPYLSEWNCANILYFIPGIAWSFTERIFIASRCKTERERGEKNSFINWRRMIFAARFPSFKVTGKYTIPKNHFLERHRRLYWTIGENRRLCTLFYLESSDVYLCKIRRATPLCAPATTIPTYHSLPVHFDII